MKKMFTTVLTGAFTAIAGFAFAEDFKPAVIYDMGGKFDKSFNEAFTTASKSSQTRQVSK